jgi:hypothetical protein
VKNKMENIEKIICSERIPSKERIVGAPEYRCNSKGACPYQWKLDESEARTFCSYDSNLVPETIKKLMADFELI